MANKLWIDGVLTPMRRATLQMAFSDPSKDVFDRKTGCYRPAELRDVSYSLDLDVDEHSGEDTAAAPAIQSIPVWKALGGRHPSLAELGQLDLKDAGSDEEWDAWFGNDAPWLIRNRLRFEGWTGVHLRARWEACSHDGLKFLDRSGPDEQRIPGGTLLFEGEVEFGGVRATVRRPESADDFIRAALGEATFAALRRVEEHRFPGTDLAFGGMVTLRYLLNDPPAGS